MYILSIKEAFLEKLLAGFKQVKVGDPESVYRPRYGSVD